MLNQTAQSFKNTALCQSLDSAVPVGPHYTPRDKAERGRLASLAPAGAQHSLTPDLMLPLPCLPPEGSTSHAQQLLGQTTHRLL